jgi:hypothetical protein
MLQGSGKMNGFIRLLSAELLERLEVDREADYSLDFS